MYGAAGALLVLLTVYEMTGVEAALAVAVACGRHLTTKARRDLRASGLQVPSVREYFETLLRFCVASDWGKRPVPPPA